MINRNSLNPVGRLLLVVAIALMALSHSTLSAKQNPSPGKDEADGKVASKVEAEVSEEIPRELSTAPQQFPIYPEDRPMWVDQSDNIGDRWAELVVLSVPSLSVEKSAESLAEQQQLALSAYAEQIIGVAGSSDLLTFTQEQIETRLVDSQRTYDGTLTTSTGEMHQHACVLVLDDAFHDEIVDQWKEREVAERLKGMGVIGGLAFAGLMLATGLLRTIAPRTQRQRVEA